eukprot:1354429-Alexandrium_andersonii.AAC.1
MLGTEAEVGPEVSDVSEDPEGGEVANRALAHSSPERGRGGQSARFLGRQGAPHCLHKSNRGLAGPNMVVGVFGGGLIGENRSRFQEHI